MIPELYTTERNTSAELVSKLINKAPMVAVYRVGPIGLNADDVLHAISEMEVTTDEKVYNTMLATQIILSTDPNAISGLAVTDANAQNVTPAVHHMIAVKHGFHKVITSGSYYVMLLARCASSSGLLGLRVEQNYGHLDVAVWRI